MKFSIGYQLSQAEEESFAEIVAEFAEHVAEVYFAPPGAASGRSPLPADEHSQRRFADDLRSIRDLGMGLNMLVNANCYGGAALSRQLERQVVGQLRLVADVAGQADSVTTTSPAVAAMVKRHFPAVRVIASVNMRIGTVQGMEYLADLFDGYYIQRDFNRDIEHVRRVKAWTDARGKRLCMLVNSGCLRFCSGQTFHDNLVAHEGEVAAADNIDGFMPYACWNHLRRREHWPAVLQATWIRPEDLHHYDGLFQTVKLATRLHDRPWAVVRSYAAGRHQGNLLDLLEPGFSPAFAPWAIDNSRMPRDWFQRTSTCHGRCYECGYCRDALQAALVEVSSPVDSWIR